MVFTHGRIIIQKLLASSVSQILWYPIFKSIGPTYWKPSYLSNILLILGLVYGLRLSWLFEFLNSLRIFTLSVLGLGCAKDGSPHSDPFGLSSTPSITKRYISFFFFFGCLWYRIWYWTYCIHIPFLLLVYCICSSSNKCSIKKYIQFFVAT